MKANQPPRSQKELLHRAQMLSNCTIHDIATHMRRPIPTKSINSKGWLGQLLEDFLGANSGSLSRPDFNHLGIELKTLPLNLKGTPKESTYVCTAPLQTANLSWRDSSVYKKLASVLWVPYFEANNLEQRRIGTPFLWNMPPKIENILKQDWLEIREIIKLGHFDKLSAHHGIYLQIRPKAMNSKNFVKVINHDGQEISIVPKGYYLRPSLTQQILKDTFSISY